MIETLSGGGTSTLACRETWPEPHSDWPLVRLSVHKTVKASANEKGSELWKSLGLAFELFFIILCGTYKHKHSDCLVLSWSSDQELSCESLKTVQIF